jgi:hypothetical protein
MMHAQKRSAMPGAFDPRADYPAGRKANVFQPPRTPSTASSTHLRQSEYSIISGAESSATTGRKRAWSGFNLESKTTPTTKLDWGNGFDTEDSIARSENLDPGSPIPFVNTKYRLAGGLDTPTGVLAAQFGGDSEFSDIGYRTALDSNSTKRANGYFPEHASTLAAEQNGKPQIRALRQQTNTGWSKVALNVVGGVVGKVWEFCKAGAFAGFTSGGGTRYGAQAQPLPGQNREPEFWNPESARRAYLLGIDFEKEMTPLPGQFPNDDFIPDYMDRATPESTPPRAAKRRQVSSDANDGLGKNWVVVSSKPAPPQVIPKPVARYSMPTASTAHRRQTPSTASRPGARAGTGARRPLMAASRASTVSHAGSPALRPSHSASFASPRSPGGSKIPVPINTSSSFSTSSPTKTASPAAIEAQKWVAKKRKEDREADESIRRFNAQLQAMIREGQEALGTKFEVRDEDDVMMEEGVDVDEGFEDGEFDNFRKRR